MTPGQNNNNFRKILDSASEVRFGWAKVAILLVVLAAAFSAGSHVWYRKSGDPVFGVPIAKAQESAIVAEVATLEPTQAPTQAPHVIEVEKIVVVTATPVPATPTARIEYIYVDGPSIEVTRIVEVTPSPLPTVTAVPLAPGTVEICASVEGARDLYIGGQGVVSGACRSFSFGVGQTSIQVQINK